MSIDDSYLQVKWTYTSYNKPNRSVLKIPKNNVRFMCKANLLKDPLLDKDGYSYMSSLGDIYIKDQVKITESRKKIVERHMIVPLNLLLFKFQWIYPQNDYRMKCKCTEKRSKFDFLLINPTIHDVIKGVIEKIAKYNIKLLSDINICLEDNYIIGIYFKYEDRNGKAQRFLGR